MTSINKLGAVAAFAAAAIYLAAFVFYGALVQYPNSPDPAPNIAYLTSLQVSLYLANVFGYLVFGLVLAVLVVTLQQRVQPVSVLQRQLTGLFGFIWVGLVLAAGMIANVALLLVTDAAVADPTSALATWKTLNYVVAGLGGSNEIVGGLWVLLVSLGARQNNQLPRSLCVAGGSVGACGVATVYPVESLTELFGVSQLIWFVWLGLVLWRAPQDAAASAG